MEALRECRRECVGYADNERQRQKVRAVRKERSAGATVSFSNEVHFAHAEKNAEDVSSPLWKNIFGL